MLGRQRLDNIANIDVGAGGVVQLKDNQSEYEPNPMKESLDVQNKHVWDRTDREDYSVFAQNNPRKNEYKRNSN